MTRRLRAILLGLALALMVPASTEAQDWGSSYFPYLTTATGEFPVFAFRYLYQRPSAWDDPYPAAGDFRAEVGVGIRGGWFTTLRFRAPGLWEGWRLRADIDARREPQFFYFGLGNETIRDEALERAEKSFYKVRRVRYRGDVEVTRNLVGHFGAAAALGITFARFSPPAEPSLFRSDFGGTLREDTDASLRVSLLYDSRDTDYNTRHGVLLEAGATVASGGKGYTRLHTNLRGFLSVREGTVLAGRLVMASTTGEPTLDARYDVDMWEQPVRVFGGDQSNRGLADSRYLGEDVLFVNAEIRHDILNLGDYGALTALVFVDAGRVFDVEPFKITTADWHTSVGAGLALRVLRSSIATFNFSDGPDGFEFEVGTGWMF